MANFREATEVIAAEDGVFDAKLDPQWTVGAKFHGGYLLAILGRAAIEVAGEGHPDLSAVSAVFVAPPEAGPAQATVELLRESKGASQLRARLSQDGRPCADALLTLGTLSAAEPFWAREDGPDHAPEQDCIPVAADMPGAPFRVPLMDVLRQRIDPRAFDPASGQPGTIASWQRLADGTDWDPLSLLIALDPVPPVSYALGIPGWAPTVQFSAYLRRRPAPGPVRVRMRANEISGNRMDEVASAWDSEGRLVGQANQLAAVRQPG